MTSIGQRIHVTGNTCAGKTTLGEHLATRLSVPHVDLDAINWQPDWVALVDTDPELFQQRINEATAGDGWVVSGSYSGFSRRGFWDRLETVIWLDMPLWLLVWRVLTRSWRRWRSKELLWGYNEERFWPQLAVWNKEDSLLWWAVTQQERKRRELHEATADDRWSHIRFTRLASPRQVAAFERQLAAEVSGAAP